VLENELEYHGLAVRSAVHMIGLQSKNLVNFCLVTPQMTGLIWERQIRHGQKNWRISLNISGYWTDFSQSFHHMKALYMQMMDLYLIFQFVKGRCHGNQILLP